jgi:hypothetical protein
MKNCLLALTCLCSFVALCGGQNLYGSVLYTQDFSTPAPASNDPVGWTDVNFNWAISSGEYRCDQPSSGSQTGLSYYNAGGDWTDYSTTINYRYANGAYAGLVGHVASMMTYYHVRYNADSDYLQLIKFVDGNVSWIEQSANTVDIGAGVPMLMRLSFNGTEVTAQFTNASDVNFENVLQSVVKDDVTGFIASGGVGVRSAANNNSVAVVDSLIVETVPEPCTVALCLIGASMLTFRRTRK